MNHTSREIATVSGVSVQAVHKHIQKQGIKPVESRGNTFYYSLDDATKVINLIKPDIKVAEVGNRLIVIDNAVDNNQTAFEVIEILKQQLVVKDEQIKELNERLKEANQEHELLWLQVESQRKTIEANAGKELLQAAAVSQDPEQPEPEASQTSGKRSFFQRWHDAISAFKK